jgi:AcrR family transcriptional regulator
MTQSTGGAARSGHPDHRPKTEGPPPTLAPSSDISPTLPSGADPSSLAPSQRRRARLSLEIERAALTLMARNGIDRVTVDQIATAADISSRSFYRYFHNVSEVLTAVPQRHAERLSRQAMLRPENEELREALRAVYREQTGPVVAIDPPDGVSPLDQIDRLAAENLSLWIQVVRQEPDLAGALSHAPATLAGRLEDVVRARLQIPSDDRLTAGVLAAALAGAMWFATLQWISSDDGGPLASQLDEALDRLGLLHSGVAHTQPGGRRRRSRA